MHTESGARSRILVNCASKSVVGRSIETVWQLFNGVREFHELAGNDATIARGRLSVRDSRCHSFRKTLKDSDC